MLSRNDLSEYIAAHYGTCAMGERCCCLRVGWGRACDNWRPVNASTWDELRDEMIRIYRTEGVASR